MFTHSWKWNITKSRAKELTTQGFSDLKGIAERFKKRYPALFEKDYSPENYYVRVKKSTSNIDFINSFLVSTYSNGKN